MLTRMSLWNFGHGGAIFHARLVRNGWKVLRGSTALANTSTTGVASINVYVMLTNFIMVLCPIKNSNIRLTSIFQGLSTFPHALFPWEVDRLTFHVS